MILVLLVGSIDVHGQEWRPVPVDPIAVPPVEDWSNFNLHGFLSEQLANRVLARRDTQTGAVRDFVLGADVVGQQTTDTSLVLDFSPNQNYAQVNLVLTGSTFSDTIGITRQAQVNTLGMHQFAVVKPCFFDGTLFATADPVSSVSASNTTRSVHTPLSCAPLIGPMVDAYAFREAERRQPLGEAIAAQRLSDRIVPQFNQSIDEGLAWINRHWASVVHASLERMKLRPAALRVTTTDQRLHFRALIESQAEGIAEFGPPPELSGAVSATVMVHETVLNALADSLHLHGKSLNNRELDELSAPLRAIGQATSHAADDGRGPAFHLEQRDNGLEAATLVFDDSEPLRVRIENDVILVTLRVEIVPMLPARIPPVEIGIPFRAEIRDGRILIDPGEVTVNLADEANDGAAFAVMQPLIRQQIQSRLEPIDLPLAFPLRLSDTQTLTLTLTLRELAADRGWLVVGFD